MNAKSQLALSWSEFALADVNHIIDFISEDDPGAARRVYEKIEKSVSRLTHFPLSGRAGRVSGTRELSISSYVLVYRVQDAIIIVLRVLHAAQQWP